MNLRRVATKILLDVLEKGQSLTAALEFHLKPHAELTAENSRNKAFIQAACYGVLRHYFELEDCLNRLLNKPFKAKELDVKILALLGLYQLKYMRVKEHAAVSETVAAAKRYPWAKSVLNAVFRRYLRERESLDTIAHHNHPQWLYQQLQQDWPAQVQEVIFQNNQAAPMVLRVNLAQCSRDEYLALLDEANIFPTINPLCSTSLQLQQPLMIELIPKFAEGWVSVQDSAAQLASQLLEVQPGQRVLDLCAAPGGKTCAILEQHPELQEVWAVDIDAQRLQRVHDNLQRIKIQATVIAGDATSPESWWDGRQFERILLDAPCSATGVIRRHPDIKLLRLADDIPVLVALQQQILQQTWRLLAPGGILVYATCSLLKAENSEQIAQFLQSHADAEELPIAADWGLACQHGRQILTGMHAMDGFYYARLRKR